MTSEKILKFIKAFQNEFDSFLINPNTKNMPEHEKHRLIIKNKVAILPAQNKFSDWDLYYYVDKSEVNEKILENMRSFIFNWKDFSLIRDYVTKNPLNMEEKSYQSFNNLFWVQFMGIIENEIFGPFLDIHIIGSSKETLRKFYSSIKNINDEGYLDWSIITLWRKFCISGEIEKEKEMFKKSVYPALTIEEKINIDTDPELFFKKYFKNKKDFENVFSFLSS